MTRYLHSLSATLFYILAGSMFAAYVLAFNNILKVASLQWLHMADLPLLCVALLYGGTSVYLSVTNDKKSSPSLGLALGIPLALLFLIAAILKFWPTTFVLNS